VAVDEVLCQYRIHGLNASMTKEVDSFEDLRIVREFLPDPHASVAVLRLIFRHLKKSIKSQRPPELRKLFRALT
jgi:hypothetical protein